MGKRGRVVALAAAGVALIAVAGTVLFGGPGSSVAKDLGIKPIFAADPSGLAAAIDVVPSETKRLSFTDWSKVRTALKTNFSENPDRAEIEAMISKAYDTDFSAVSSIDEAAAALQENFGFSPATMDWEAFAQSDNGATMVVRMPDDFDLDSVRSHLTDLGFTKPKDTNGVWEGGTDLVAAIDPTITPELQYVAVLGNEHLIVTSDTESYAKKTALVALGDKKSLGDEDSARGVIEPLKEPAAAMFWSRDFACSDLSMGQQDPDTQKQADALVAKAGKITPLTGLVMAFGSDRMLTVSELFESDSDARENLKARAKLAVGDAPERDGSYSDDMSLVSSGTDGSAVNLVFTPREKTGYLLSTLTSGPVLFATC